jgi:hypothetical protein
VNRLVVLDLDPRHGSDESLLELEETCGRLPPTFEVRTGSGGLHLYFALPPGLKIKSTVGWRPGIDIRGEGGLVIGVGSRHISGGRYEVADHSLPVEQMAELPAWLIPLLPREAEPTTSPTRFTITDVAASALQRATAYVGNAENFSEGGRNDGAFRLAGHVASFGLGESEVFALLATWNLRNNPPLSDNELRACVASAFRNGTPRPAKETSDGNVSQVEVAKPCDKFTFAELEAGYPHLNPPVVHGLFRQGETVNLVSTSKVGKSWLAYSLSLSIIAGFDWLERFKTEQGRVLLVDNELHRGTLANRIPAVAKELGIQPAQYATDLEVWPLRGNLRNLIQLGEDFNKVEAGTFKVIILDAKYRFAFPGKSENDNAAETLVYNLLDQYAAHTAAAFVLVHHTSKGSQGEKRVVDVGAGAGAQSRAADCHLILREHEQPDVAVLDAAVRSFAPVEPLALKWDFPLWRPTAADVSRLKGRLSANEQRQNEKDREALDKIIAELRKAPATATRIREATGFSRDRFVRLLGLLRSSGTVGTRKTSIKGNECDEYYLLP